MKARIKSLTLLILPALLLGVSSCSLNALDSFTKKIDVIDIDNTKSNNKSDLVVGQVELRFKKDQEYIPYITVSDYASLYDFHMAEGAYSKVSKRGSLITWTAYKDEGLYFISQINLEKKTVMVGGSLEATYKDDDNPLDTKSLFWGNNTQYDGFYLKNSPYATYKFDQFYFEPITFLGNTYLPLGFLDMTYSSDSSIYFHYNYDSVYSTRTVENYFTRQFYNGKTNTTVSQEMISAKSDNVMPEYLKEFNVGSFMYLLDNFYGLKEYKNYTSGVEYCKSINVYDSLFSDNGAVRAQAYADALSKFDDNHTALVAAPEAWGEQSFITRQYGQNCKNRSSIRNSLYALRQEHTSESYRNYDEILYSDDGKTAMLFFDSFVFGTTEQVFNKDNSLKDDAKYYDSFIYLFKAFSEIKDKGGVENVILDMSTNGGGVLGVLMKLLALLSSDNKGNLYYLEAATSQIGIATTQVDINDDKVCGLDDCFGDDFNFYLLTSDCSFSCGNAFPCLAQIEGIAKVIGTKSGGGECAVGTHFLPNGEYVYHSSNLHLGYYNEETEEFTGFESGAQPDIVLNSYSDFYSINTLASYISNQ